MCKTQYSCISELCDLEHVVKLQWRYNVYMYFITLIYHDALCVLIYKYITYFISHATCSTSRLFEVELPANIPRDTALKVSQCCHEQVVGSPVRMILRQQTRHPQDALLSIVGKKAVVSFLDHWKEQGYTEGMQISRLNHVYRKASSNLWSDDVSFS